MGGGGGPDASDGSAQGGAGGVATGTGGVEASGGGTGGTGTGGNGGLAGAPGSAGAFVCTTAIFALNQPGTVSRAFHAYVLTLTPGERGHVGSLQLETHSYPAAIVTAPPTWTGDVGGVVRHDVIDISFEGCGLTSSLSM